MEWLIWLVVAMAAWVSASILTGLLVGTVLGRARGEEAPVPVALPRSDQRRAA